MSKLNAECKMWMDKIELEVKRVEELEGATFTLYDDEYRSRKVMGGVNAAREHGHATQIHIHILEKRVFKVYTHTKHISMIIIIVVVVINIISGSFRLHSISITSTTRFL